MDVEACLDPPRPSRRRDRRNPARPGCAYRDVGRKNQDAGSAGSVGLASPPGCQVALASLEQAVKAVAEEAGREQRQQP